METRNQKETCQVSITNKQRLRQSARQGNSFPYIHISNGRLAIWIFKASALWADAFYKSICPYVCVSVCVCVCLFTF